MSVLCVNGVHAFCASIRMAFNCINYTNVDASQTDN